MNKEIIGVDLAKDEEGISAMVKARVGDNGEITIVEVTTFVGQVPPKRHNPLRYTSSRGVKRRTIREIKSHDVAKRLQADQKKRWSVFNRATRRMLERQKGE